MASVAPGFIGTERQQPKLEGPAGDGLCAQSPFGRVGTAEEVAAAILYLTSPEAQWASERYLGFTEHASPECFVCGPAREWGDGLAIFPGPLPGRHLVAAPWAPDPTLFDKRGTVRPEFIWAALDCPSGFALLEAFGRRKAVLSQLTVSLIRPLEVGARWIVMGWPFASDA